MCLFPIVIFPRVLFLLSNIYPAFLNVKDMARIMNGAVYTALQTQQDEFTPNAFETDDEDSLCEFEPESSDTECTPSATVTPSQIIAKNVSSLPAISHHPFGSLSSHYFILGC